MFNLPPANQAIRDLRLYIDLTQKDFASRLKISYALLKSIEQGGTVSLDTIRCLATFLAIGDGEYESFSDLVRRGGSLKSYWDQMQPRQSGGLLNILYNADDLPELLPPETDPVIGRNELLEDIGARLLSHRSVLLTGFSGIGKTTLAKKVVEQWLVNEDYRGERPAPVVWIEVNEDTNILDTLGRRLLKDYVSSVHNMERNNKSLMEALRKFGLILLDNVRQGDISVLVKRIPHTIAVLITSRHPVRFSETTHTITMDGLTSPDALKLLNIYAESDYSHDIDATDLCDKLLGYPPSIQIAGSLLRPRSHSVSHSVKEISNLLTPLIPGFDRFTALVEEALNDIHDDTVRKVFLAFGALCAATATPELLALFLDMDEREIRTHLFALEQRFLMLPIQRNQQTVAYRVHEIAYSTARKKLFTQSNISHDSIRISALRACAELIQRCSKDTESDGLERLHDARDNIFGVALAAVEKSGVHDEAIYTLMRDLVICGYFDRFGYVEAALPLLEQAAVYAESRMNTKDSHLLWTKLGNGSANFSKNLEKARLAYTQALKYAPTVNRRAISLVLIGTINFRLNYEDQSLDYYRQAEAAAQENPAGLDIEALSFLYEHWGHMQAQFYGKHAAAFNYFQESLRYAEQISENDKRIFRIIYAKLNMSGSQNKIAENDRDPARYRNALAYAKQALTDAQHIHANLLMGYALIEIGDQHHALGERAEAEIAYREAFHYVRQLDRARAQDLAEFMRENNYHLENH